MLATCAAYKSSSNRIVQPKH